MRVNSESNLTKIIIITVKVGTSAKGRNYLSDGDVVNERNLPEDSRPFLLLVQFLPKLDQETLEIEEVFVGTLFVGLDEVNGLHVEGKDHLLKELFKEDLVQRLHLLFPLLEHILMQVQRVLNHEAHWSFQLRISGN